MNPVSFTIVGPPRTKKTHSRIVGTRTGKPRLLPSKQFMTWQESAWVQLLPLRSRIEHPVNCQAIFYRDAEQGDAVGYYQALADILEKAGRGHAYRRGGAEGRMEKRQNPLFIGGPRLPLIYTRVAGIDYVCREEQSARYGTIQRCGKCLRGRIAHGTSLLRRHCLVCGGELRRVPC